MALPRASDNEFPSLLLKEGSAPASPAAGDQRLFVDSADHLLKLKDSAGTVTGLGGTGMTNPMTTTQDTIVGGASGTPGRLAAGAAGGVLAMGNSLVIWNAGTSFPASKATNDRYYRTDLGEEYRWDGTQWRCMTMHETTLGVGDSVLPNSSNNQALGRAPTPYLAGGTDIYLVAATFLSFVSATNDGSHYWTLNFQKTTAGNVSTTVATRNTSADTQANWTRAQVAIGAVLGTVATYPAMQLSVVLTSTPGSIYGSVTLVYNHVST